MHFKGQLLLPEEPGPGLRVNLDVAEHHLAVESDGGGLGAWPLEVVEVERLQGDVFALTVAGEPLQFVADDTIGFAYSGVPVIERFTSRRTRTRSTLRSMFHRIWNGPDDPAPSPPVSDEPEDDEATDGPGFLERVMPPAPEPGVTEHPVEPIVTAGSAVEAAEEVDVAQDPLPVEGAPEDRSCPGTTGDGRPCESQILTSSGYCYAHDPKRAFEDRYQAAQEARERLKRDATGRLNRIYNRLDKAMRQVERGELDPETASAMAQIARTMCAIVDMEDPDKDTAG